MGNVLNGNPGGDLIRNQVVSGPDVIKSLIFEGLLNAVKGDANFSHALEDLDVLFLSDDDLGFAVGLQGLEPFVEPFVLLFFMIVMMIKIMMIFRVIPSVLFWVPYQDVIH